eukprot:GEMP01014776.1.p1 GENE.GEMP01014776.1~~GEMP01014776.1.p1  ORF type:complete len:557 (+),score=82.00 GEMP01014776.1:1-1671(+)
MEGTHSRNSPTSPQPGSASSKFPRAASAANAQDGSVQNRRFVRQQLTWSVFHPEEPGDGRSSIAGASSSIPATKNHTGTLVGTDLFIFGGYDGQKNHNMLFVFDVNTFEWRQPTVQGVRPSGRNGHSATLIERKGSKQLLILGGWLGNGPLAAGDLHILHLQPILRWAQPNFTGEPPGPCNMHTADSVNGTVLVFRGGDGRAYLNDLHALDVAEGRWAPYVTTGEVPLPRANHASAVDQTKLYIFGGWDGTKRLNDLYILDTPTRVWTQIKTLGQPPQARAGMSLSYVNGLLYLFGGSGHTTKCFNDVHVFDPVDATWYEGNPIETDRTMRALPERRAGHAAVTVGTRIFAFGGACGAQYYGKGKCFILSTDAAPPMSCDMTEQHMPCSVRRVMSEYFDNEQFSDVTFAFTNDTRTLHAHRVLLALFSEHFRRMFSSGMRECHEPSVVLPDEVSYDVFKALLEFIYTGHLRVSADCDIVWLMDLLRAADQFCVDPVKRLCEEWVSKLVDASNVREICSEATRLQATALVRYCEWLMRQDNGNVQAQDDIDLCSTEF